MSGTLILQGPVEADMNEEKSRELKRKWEEKARESGDFTQVKSYFQKEKDVEKFGFSVLHRRDRRGGRDSHIHVWQKLSADR